MTRRDELGTIADGLNEMLDQLERFNQSLHDRIEEATRDLSLRNAQLAASQSELFALRESLARAERVAALGQVAANVAHQAGTPLNLVSGYVQMIRDDPRTDDRTRARLQTVDAQIQQVTRVLRTMLDHARQPSGFEVVDARRHHRARARGRAAAAVALATFDCERLGGRRSAAGQGRRHATGDGAAQPGHQRARRDARRRHAVDYRDGRVPTALRLEVADTGRGFPPRSMDRLFEPWVTTKPAGQGTGLGLAIVRDVVRAHGGSISASNQPAGALFVIDLPAADSDRSAVLAMPRILLVDDDAETCTFLEELLEAPGPAVRVGAGSRDGDRQDPPRLVRPADLGHQPERAAVGHRSAAPIHGRTGQSRSC